MNYHDTHFHLDLTPDPEGLVNLIERNKIFTIAVTNSPQVYFYTEKITKGCKYIRPALGLHPELAASRYNEIDQFISLLDKTRYIGEVGLDNHNKTPIDYKRQIMIFEKIISACGAFNDKILSVHSRRAEDDVLSVIGSNFPGKVIFHWYSGSFKTMEKAISMGCYFSINYQMTKSLRGQQIINRLPINRLLLESDGPFIRTGTNQFTPLMTKIILNGICKVRNDISHDDLKKRLSNNFRNLIKDQILDFEI